MWICKELVLCRWTFDCQTFISSVVVSIFITAEMGKKRLVHEFVLQAVAVQSTHIKSQFIQIIPKKLYFFFGLVYPDSR